jgi:hypothetical protein
LKGIRETIPISSQNAYYDPLSYIFYYPYGGTGYSPEMFDNTNKRITLMDYYNYRIHVRESRADASHSIGRDVLFYGGKLSLKFW